MATIDEIEAIREQLEEQAAEIKEDLGRVHAALDKVVTASAEDDLHDLLLDLERVVKDVRDGGVIGSGANAHRRTLRKYRELTADPMQ